MTGGKRYGAILADPPWSFRAWSGDALPSRVADAQMARQRIEADAPLFASTKAATA